MTLRPLSLRVWGATGWGALAGHCAVAAASFEDDAWSVTFAIAVVVCVLVAIAGVIVGREATQAEGADHG